MKNPITENFCAPLNFRTQGTGPMCPCDNQALANISMLNKVDYNFAINLRNRGKWSCGKGLLHVYFVAYLIDQNCVTYVRELDELIFIYIAASSKFAPLLIK